MLARLQDKTKTKRSYGRKGLQMKRGGKSGGNKQNRSLKEEEKNENKGGGGHEIVIELNFT